MPAVAVATLLVLPACSGDDAPDAEGPAAPTETSTAVDPALAGLPGAEGATVNEEGVDPLPPLPDDVALPIVFVHGFAGSAQQYESQAMRFVANGYPQDRIVAYDHDGAGIGHRGYADGLDEVVDEALESSGAEQVYLVGHSRGTFVSSTYLADPARAAKVAKYVALDGAPVPRRGPLPRADAGVEPRPVPRRGGDVAGVLRRPVRVPGGGGARGGRHRPAAGPGRALRPSRQLPGQHRPGGRHARHLGRRPRHRARGSATSRTPSFAIGDGRGVRALRGRVRGPTTSGCSPRTDSPVQHHLYLQPYVRSSDLVRLLSSAPDGATRANTNTGDDHSAVIAIRMREWYAADDADLPGDQADVLEISAGDEAPVNVLADFVGNDAIGLHLHDDVATPGETTLAALPYFSTQPFQSGVDVFLPAADPPDGTITVPNIPRGDTDRPQTLNVPNWPSSTHSISVVFTDYPVD